MRGFDEEDFREVGRIIVAALMNAELGDGDVILLDQRGTGGSHPLKCKDIVGDDDASAGHDIDLAKVRERTRACLDAVSRDADPAQYTTSVALRDLEALRQALGAPQFDLVGISYGTRVAQQYVRRYPDAVRSVVLDSAVPNELVLGSQFAIDLDAALKAQFAECTRTPACAEAFGGPYASLYRLRDALAAHAPNVAFRNPRSNAEETKPLDAQTFASVVRMFAYSSETSALLPLAIDRALKGEGGLSKTLGRALGERTILERICSSAIRLRRSGARSARSGRADRAQPIFTRRS